FIFHTMIRSIPSIDLSSFCVYISFLIVRQPPRYTLFPYTTLFRSIEITYARRTRSITYARRTRALSPLRAVRARAVTYVSRGGAAEYAPAIRQSRIPRAGGAQRSADMRLPVCRW